MFSVSNKFPERDTYHSPGLRYPATLGENGQSPLYPNGVASKTGRNPFGVKYGGVGATTQGSGVPQPWAVIWNPVGILAAHIHLLTSHNHQRNGWKTARFHLGRCYYMLFLILFFSCLITGTVAYAAPVDTIRDAQHLMEQGAAQEALDTLKELQVDYPESPEVRFGIGCAWFMLAEAATTAGNVEEAKKAYQESRTAFDALIHNENTGIAREAMYNRANCTLREAATIDTAQQYADAVAALRRAVEAYESGLEQYPEHEGMHANLEHARFQLKQLLQNPPPEQEQQDQQPPEEEPPAVMSLFGQVNTSIPGAEAKSEDNTAILVLPEKTGGQP